MQRIRVEGYAIVSADDMIADANGVQPKSLLPEADQRHFYAGLAQAAAVVHGAHSAEADAQQTGRPRLIVTRQVVGCARDARYPRAVRWNPEGTSLSEAYDLLEPGPGSLIVIGGTGVFGLFLTLGYDEFHLTRVAGVRLPGGRPLFPADAGKSAEAQLQSAGFFPDTPRSLDGTDDLTLTTWLRRDV